MSLGERRLVIFEVLLSGLCQFLNHSSRLISSSCHSFDVLLWCFGLTTAATSTDMLAICNPHASATI